jgi:cytochrome c oxidase subunit 3
MQIALSPSLPVKRPVSNSVLGMIFLLATEAMFFAGLISAYVVNRSGAMAWPPPGQPRLPIEVTAANTVILVLSAVALLLFRKNYFRTGSRSLLRVAMLLGAVFIVVQGVEWVRLIGFGLTTRSSLFGSFFYTIIGIHAAHAVAGLMILVYLVLLLRNSLPGEDAKNKITTCSMYWIFVVAIWPLLYSLVYLNLI